MTKLNKIIEIAIHVIEYTLSIMTIGVLIGHIGHEIYDIFTVEGCLWDSNLHLTNILAIVVGLEFVKMLINFTPENTIEVLTVAIARQVIVNHNTAVSDIIWITCIAALFAIRVFLVPKCKARLKNGLKPAEQKEESDEQLLITK